MTASYANIVIGLVVLAWVISRQLRVRTVNEERAMRLLVILGVIGLYEVAQFADRHTVSSAAWALVGASLVGSLLLGVLRGRTVRVWRDANGALLQQGTAVTLVLWAVSIAVHLGADLVLHTLGSAAVGLGSASLVLYLAVTLGVQRVVVVHRGTELVGHVGREVHQAR